MRKWLIVVIGLGVLIFVIFVSRLNNNMNNASGLMLDSFEGEIGPKTFDVGASQFSTIAVEAAKEISFCGEQSVKLSYHLEPAAYMFCARGYGLDVLGSTWEGPPPGQIKWENYNAISFQLYGNNTGLIAFDVKDAGHEMWRYLIDDNFKGWKEIIVPFDSFKPREDWQPRLSDGNKQMDFPIKHYQWELKIPGDGTLYFDCVKLVTAEK